jgi:hypothetical protein
MTRNLLLLATAALLCPSMSVAPIADVSAPPAHVVVIDGAASLTRDGREEAVVAGTALIEGDALQTDDARVEVGLADGSDLYLDAGSHADLQSGSHFRLFAGYATLVVTESADRGSPFRVDTPAASVLVDGPGEYRVAVLADSAGAPAVTELAVVRGSARLESASGNVFVRTGERALAREAEPPSPGEPFNSARWSAFDRWVADRRSGRETSRSASYLPPEVEMYAPAFDRYGTWGDMPGYGAVWYPTAIGAGWRPYFNGHWDSVGRFGWLWVGAEPWGWPTHHFGHWGFHRGSWFWRPGRIWGHPRVWWGVSPSHVAWCPIGIDGRPLFGFFGHRGRLGFDPWRGWTVVARGAFGARAHVGSAAIDFRRFGHDPHNTFVFQRHAPAGRFAGPRNTWVSGTRAGAAATMPGAISGSGGSRRAGSFGVPVGSGARRSGDTRIESPPIGMVPIYPYGRSAVAESPYQRAERVARERRGNDSRTRQAVPRSPAAPGAVPPPSPSRSPYATPSPYPPRYQAAPPGSSVPQGRSAQPRAGGSSSQSRTQRSVVAGPAAAARPRSGGMSAAVPGQPMPASPRGTGRTAVPRARP